MAKGDTENVMEEAISLQNELRNFHPELKSHSKVVGFLYISEMICEREVLEEAGNISDTLGC